MIDMEQKLRLALKASGNDGKIETIITSIKSEACRAIFTNTPLDKTEAEAFDHYLNSDGNNWWVDGYTIRYIYDDENNPVSTIQEELKRNFTMLANTCLLLLNGGNIQ